MEYLSEKHKNCVFQHELLRCMIKGTFRLPQKSPTWLFFLQSHDKKLTQEL